MTSLAYPPNPSKRSLSPCSRALCNHVCVQCVISHTQGDLAEVNALVQQVELCNDHGGDTLLLLPRPQRDRNLRPGDRQGQKALVVPENKQPELTSVSLGRVWRAAVTSVHILDAPLLHARSGTVSIREEKVNSELLGRRKPEGLLQGVL